MDTFHAVYQVGYLTTSGQNKIKKKEEMMTIEPRFTYKKNENRKMI